MSTFTRPEVKIDAMRGLKEFSHQLHPRPENTFQFRIQWVSVRI